MVSFTLPQKKHASSIGHPPTPGVNLSTHLGNFSKVQDFTSLLAMLCHLKQLFIHHENDVNQRSLATQLWRDWVDTPEVSFQPSIQIVLDITRYNLTGSTSMNPPWTHQLHHLPGNQPALVPINKQETVLSLERSLLSMRLSMNLCESARHWYHENGRYTNCIPWDPLIGSELQYWIIGFT